MLYIYLAVPKSISCSISCKCRFKVKYPRNTPLPLPFPPKSNTIVHSKLEFLEMDFGTARNGAFIKIGQGGF